MIKDLSPVFDLIRADGSIVLNKNLCFAIGINSAIVYSELLSRYNYFNTRDELDEEGYFYNTVEDLQLATTLGEKSQRSAISELKKVNLILYKVKGLPPKRYFKINEDLTILLNLLYEGKNAIKELEKKQLESAEKSKLRLKGGINSSQTEKTIPPILPVNNTNSNNTNLIILNKDGFGKNEIREGYSILEVTPTNSIPFYDFLAGLLKRCKTDYREEILESIIYYYSKYKEVLDEEHVRYKEETCIEIISRLDTVYDMGIEDESLGIFQDDITVDMFKEMVDKHFQTNYKKMQYTLLSFLNDKVLKNRFYEVCY